MYAFLWRSLPGDTRVKLLIMAGLLLVAGLLLWYYAFPWIEPKIQFDHGTVDGGTTPRATPHR